MIELLTKLADQLNSSVFVLLMILLAAGYALYKLGSLIRLFDHHEEKITDLKGLANDLIGVKIKVDLIYQRSLGQNSPVISQSPINLTDAGRQIVQRLNADVLLKKYLARLKAEVDASSPKHAYDIQMSAMKVAKEKMISCLNADELNTVKTEAVSRGLLVEDIMSVFGVLLRDIILAERNMSIADVDIHTPKPV